MPKSAGSDGHVMKAKQLQPKKKRSKKKSHLSLRGVAVFLLLVLVGTVGIFGFMTGVAQGRIADGVTAGPIIIGGLTPAEAREAITSRLESYTIAFRADEVETDFNPLTLQDDEGRFLARFDVDQVIERAYAVGRRDSSLTSTLERAGAYLIGRNVGLPIELSPTALTNELQVRFAGVYAPAVNATIEVSLDRQEAPIVEIKPERDGTDLIIDGIAELAKARLTQLSVDPIVIPVDYDSPEITRTEAELVSADVTAAVARGPLELNVDTTSWTVSRQLLASWLDVVSDGEGGARLGFNRSRLKKYLESKAPEFAVTPKDAIFEMENGRVTRIEAHEDGQALDIDGAIALITEAVFGEPAPDTGSDILALELPLEIVSPEVTTEQSNPYGIKEIIGVGDSNFRGSPYNRRINIQVGADSLHGLIIQPDTEFSLIEALGDIDGEAGYKQELVIKGSETKPEYGGGLCQIGTTTFRAVMAAGMEVTERRNHSYRVPYYERDGMGNYIGPGKDATIYDPWPDFKFRNDTGHPVVLMTEIDGNWIGFTFWGVSDGRVAEESEVAVWNRVDPPEKVVTPTDTLPPGEEKCTESPHPGADTAFTYTVTWPDGEVKEKKFYSHYRPWGEVCLVGIDPDAPPIELPDNANTLISADASGASGE
jgi:vancomycin resistance protein YoaR